MDKKWWVLFLLLMTSGLQSQSNKLAIYFLDMAGGGSTLIVTPDGESILIDTGSLEPTGRDDGRIYQACRDAGVRQIDHLITTHFHSDHFGAILPLLKKIPVKKFYDKGAPAPAQEQNSQWFKKLYPLYQSATAGKARTITVGEVIPLHNKEIKLLCLAAEKKVLGFSDDIDAAQPGFIPQPADLSDNGRSIALLLTWGDFACFMGGDITFNVEHHLVSPLNFIGQVDLYQVTHHGLDLSNNPELLRAIQPIVAVAMNGPQKGVQPRTFATLNALPSLRALYQIHYNTQYGDPGNVSPDRIANGKEKTEGRNIMVLVDKKAKEMAVRIGQDGTPTTFPFN